MALNPAHHPRVYAYLARLPNGLLSHPECEAKASMYRSALEALPRPLDTAELDPLVASYIDEPVPVSSWIPEVVHGAIYLAIADQIFGEDEAFLQWVFDVAEETFRSPTYRFLMAVASPRMLAKGGERRWAAFHRGTSLTVKVGENGATSRLAFPHNLFDLLIARATGKAILAAYRASGATEATYEVDEFTSTYITYRSVWYPSRSAAAEG